MTASERAKEINERNNPAGFPTFKLMEDAAHWAEVGVYTADELNRYLAVEAHQNAYKDFYGVRPRHVDYSVMTTDQIDALTDRLMDKVYEAE